MSVSAANITETAEVASPDTGTRSRKKLSFSIIIGGTIVAVVVLAAVVSFFWTPYDPLQVNADSRFLPPSSAHWLGTDALGRDVFSNLLAGARIALLVGIITVGVGALIGVPIGVFAAVNSRPSTFITISKMLSLLLQVQRARAAFWSHRHDRWLSVCAG